MLSNGATNQSLLYSANSKKSDKNGLSLLTPIRENSILNRNTSSKDLRSVGTATTKISTNTSQTPRRSIKIIKPETIKRANNDAWMAAAIGDLEWLKNSLKISSEVVFDKNGFATLHLACIHGRLNIIKYLIEEQKMNVNFPSTQGWCPIHLCINNNIGSKAVDCLKYLIKQGADISVKNQDGTYPLHMAASEGQAECLKILLDLKADTNLTDNRGQTALDLAKLWGHRSCAKYLNNEMWCNEKKIQLKENQLERQLHCQQLLKQVKAAYEYYYENEEDAEKEFENWLVQQVNASVGNTPRIDLVSRQNKSRVKFKSTSELNITQHSRPLRPETDWNHSIKTNQKPYISNLNDFYPRDPFTMMPTDSDLLFLNKELKNQSIDKIKGLMKKEFPQDVFMLEKDTDRKVVYKPKHVLDGQLKTKNEEVIDTTGLHLTCGDPSSYSYKKVENYVTKRLPQNVQSESYGNHYLTKQEVRNIKDLLSENKPKRTDEKLKIIEKSFGKDLSDFMEDKRHGKMSQKYEKVFIC